MQESEALSTRGTSFADVLTTLGSIAGTVYIADRNAKAATASTTVGAKAATDAATVANQSAERSAQLTKYAIGAAAVIALGVAVVLIVRKS